MQKIYLLLRSNKQSGPYSLSELIALQLKPFDLVWVEGRSRSWEYPTEIDELKVHVKQDKHTKESVTVYPQASADLVLPRTNKKPNDEKSEEKLNVQVYVKLPHESEAERFFSDNNQLLPAEDKEPGGRAKGPVVQNADGLLNTKYTRDLQEIKEEYTAWIGQRKQTEVNRQQNKPWLIWAIIAFLGLAGFLSERWSSSNAASAKAMRRDTLAVKKQATPIQSKSAKAKKNNRSNDKNEKSKKAASATVLAEEKIRDKKKQADSIAKNNQLLTQNKRPAKPNAQALLSILDINYSSDSGRHAGINGLIFTIHNRSEHKLNTVALHVYYNNSEGQMLVKETIHFNHVQPGATVFEHAPSNEHAASVHYEVALINTDEITYDVRTAGSKDN